MGKLVQFLAPEGAPQVSNKGYLRWHHEALQSPRGIEIAITDMRRALLRYGIEHKERYGAELGGDGFLGDHWLQMARGYLGMLNGETGRLDCGTLDGELRRWAMGFGFEEEL